MGLKPADYLRLTWREFVLLTRAFNNNLSRQMQHVRVIAYYSVAPYFKKPIPIKKFMPLDSDKDGDEDEMKQAKRLLAKAKERAEQMKNTNPNIK